MRPIAYLVKEAVPDYLSSLPIPDTFTGWFKLSLRDWLSLVPPMAVGAGVYYTLYRAYCPKTRDPKYGHVNLTIKKDNPKVVDTIDIEDITDKVVLCRCWRSENWPYCDGKHGTHNRCTGDNVGPVVIAHKKA